MALELHHGEVWMFEFARPNKRRPVLILSADIFLKKLLHQVTVAEVTSRLRDSPAEVRLGIEHGLKTESAVNLINIAAVPRSLLRQYVTTLPADKMKEVCRALAITVGC